MAAVSKAAVLGRYWHGTTIRHNKRARPYKWSYDADAEHARYLERHPQPEPQRPPSPKPHDSNAQSPSPSQELVRCCTN
jgi:hypothetical protein